MSLIFDIRTIQAGPFKTLCESLKDLLIDTVIKISDTGIKIVTMNNDKVILVHLVLHADKFESYECRHPISIGINMLNFYKIIKTINNQDTLTLFMHENDKNHLGVKIENHEKNTRSTYKVNLLDLEDIDYDIPNVTFNTVITLPLSDLHKNIRDMNSIAEYVDIKCVNNEFIMTCQGDSCSQETIISDNNNNVDIRSDNKDDIIQGNFSLKYLNLFTKCTTLSSTTEIYLKNDYPLIVRYTVASLGEIKLCLTPRVNDPM